MEGYSFDCSLYLPRAASATNGSFSLIKEIQSTALGTVKLTCLDLPPLPLLTFLAIIRPNVSNSFKRERDSASSERFYSYENASICICSINIACRNIFQAVIFIEAD